MRIGRSRVKLHDTKGYGIGCMRLLPHCFWCNETARASSAVVRRWRTDGSRVPVVAVMLQR
jgi:hypothetical protein